MPLISGRGDTSVVKYSTMGSDAATGGIVAGTALIRYYVPGNAAGLVNSAGSSLTSFYSTGRFMPGTTVRWEPAVSFTVSGRVLVGFTDNPEVIVTMTNLRDTLFSAPNAANLSAYISAVKGLGSIMAFPVWQATNVPFPTRVRRKRFDINVAVANNVDTYDRSAQTVMFVGLEGVPFNTTFGSFHYHDIIDVEGVHPIAT